MTRKSLVAAALVGVTVGAMVLGSAGTASASDEGSATQTTAGANRGWAADEPAAHYSEA